MTERPTCCWTHCDNEQGVGTWTEINGETLPVCEEHWYGNLDAERRRLRAEVERLGEQVDWWDRFKDEAFADDPFLKGSFDAEYDAWRARDGLV